MGELDKPWPDLVVPLAHPLHGHTALVVEAVLRGALLGQLPHGHLADKAGEERAQRGVVVDALDTDLDRPVEDGVVEGGGAVEHLPDEPHVMVDHARGEVHGCLLSRRREAKAPRGVEVRGVDAAEQEPGGRPAPPRRR